MTKKKGIQFIFILSFFSFAAQKVYSQSDDTLYFNSRWQICEKPFASYYRFGKVVIDTFWYYRGQVADYYTTDTLQMEGSYSTIGEKDGLFSFFYEDGTLKARGRYSNNHLKGVWDYFYRNGKSRMKIVYGGNDVNFIVLNYADSTGKFQCKDGTGGFEMYMARLNGFGTTYRVEGEFKDEKKSGTWKYYAYLPAENKEVLAAKEIYEEGILKKGIEYSLYNSYSDIYKKPREIVGVLDFEKLKTTESFAKDKTSFRNWKDDQDLADYLQKKQAPSFDVEDTSFEESFFNVLKTLNTPSVIRFFKDPEKIYKGEILINLSDSGNIEEIEITGNLSEKEKEYMQFFLQKFKNIHEIIVENVGIDAYHKIFFFSVIFSEVIPKRYLSNFPEKQFIFSMIPYDKLKEAAKLKRKKGK